METPTIRDLDFIEGQIHITKLRTAAISWVNHLRRCNRDLQLPKDTIEVNWIIQFFDLQERELKSQN